MSAAQPEPVKRELRPIAATVYMLGAVACFSFNSVVVRLAAEEVHPFEVAFFRNFFAIFFILALVLPVDGWSVLRFRRFDMLALRGGINSAAMLMWFYSVPLLPLADLTALGFTAPLWATVLAALLLGEVVRVRRWTATAIGFAGALWIIQPGFKEMHWATYLVLASAACWAVTIIVVRHMTSYERANTILVYQAVIMSAISLVPALFVWQWPSLETTGWMVGLGALAAGAHWCHVRAYSMQEVAALQPLDFSRLPIVALTAWLIFGEVAGSEVWVGAGLIFTAGLYISYREAQLKRRRLASG